MSSSALHTPLFRPDIEATREDDAGTAYVRIADPRTRRDTRLYALEYEVAQAMDGRRTLGEIAAHVAATQGVTPSLDDLSRFVAHLVSQGFVVDPELEPQWPRKIDPQAQTQAEGLPKNEASLTETATLAASSPVFSSPDEGMPVASRPTLISPAHEEGRPPPVHQPLEGSDTALSPADPVSAGVYALVTEELDLHALGDPLISADPEDLADLVRRGIDAVKANDVGAACAIFNAAHDLEPKNRQLAVLLATATSLAERPTTESVPLIMVRARDLFPEFFTSAGTSGTDTPTEPDPPGAHGASLRAAAAQARRPKGLLQRFGVMRVLAGTAVAIILMAAGVWGGRFLRQPSVVRVDTQEIILSAHPMVAPTSASEIMPSRQVWLAAPHGGILETTLEPGTKVAPGDIVATLHLPPDDAADLLRAREDVRLADARISSLVAERQAVATRRRFLQQSQQSQQAPKRANRRDSQRALAHQLVHLDRRDRVLRAALVEGKSQHARAVDALVVVEQELADDLVRAPFGGTVGQTKLRRGATLRAHQALVMLEDRQQMTVSFALDDIAGLSPQSRAEVLVEGPNGSDELVAAMVDDVTDAPPASTHKHLVRVAFGHKNGAFSSRAPHAFHLVRGQTVQALWVPKDALRQGVSGAQANIWLLDGALLLRREVEVIQRNEDGGWVRPQGQGFPQGAKLVIGAQKGLSTLHDGQPAEAIVES